MLHFGKKLFKHSKVIKHTIVLIIFLYLKLIYFTTRWKYTFSSNKAEKAWCNLNSTIILAWHDSLTISPYILIHQNHRFHMLVSPHSDGIIISSILKMLGFNIIAGSTNKNPTGAIRGIIQKLRAGENIAITPDGPRGPRHEINSNIIEVAKKCNACIIPVSCKATNYFRLNSWDKLILPMPFGRVGVYVGDPIYPAQEQISKDDLKTVLNNLDTK